MQQSEVIQQALREAPPSTAVGSLGEPEAGEKLIRALDLGDVDHDIVTAWVVEHGGTALQGPEGDLHWRIAEAELAL